jgi:assimilatory nitrate reductase catalytic subunit
VLLPALGWGEKDGTVTNSERRISRQRSFLPAPGGARRLAILARWRSAWALQVSTSTARTPCSTSMHACRPTATNGPGEAARVFNLGGLAGMRRQSFDSMEPIQWPVQRDADGWPQGTARLFGDGRFAFADGKARFVATAPRAPVHAPDASIR